jgi:hypothetical protein
MTLVRVTMIYASNNFLKYSQSTVHLASPPMITVRGGSSIWMKRGHRIGRFTLKFTVNFKDFPNFKKFTPVNFKDDLQIRGIRACPFTKM